MATRERRSEAEFPVGRIQGFPHGLAPAQINRLDSRLQDKLNPCLPFLQHQQSDWVSADRIT
jgi:hypothetical protein